MNTKRGAQRLMSYNCTKPAFCGFYLCIIRCMLLLDIFVCFYIGAETARALWFFKLPVLCFEITRHWHMSRGVIINLVCGLMYPMNSINRKIQRRQQQQKKTGNNSGSVWKWQRFQWTCKHKETYNLTFKRMLSMCLPTLPPVVIFVGEFVVFI